MNIPGIVFLLILAVVPCFAQPYRELGLRIDSRSNVAADVTIAGVRIDTGYIFGRRDDLLKAVGMKLLSGDVCHLLPSDDSLTRCSALVPLPASHGWLMPGRIRIVMQNGRLFLRVFERVRRVRKKEGSGIAKVDAYVVDRDRLLRITYDDGYEVQLYTSADVNLSYRQGEMIVLPGVIRTKRGGEYGR